MINLDQATDWLSARYAVDLRHASFVKCSLKDKVYRYFNPAEKNFQIQRITNYVLKKLEDSTLSEEPRYLKFAELLISHYREDRTVEKVIRTFDRQLVKHRAELKFSCLENQEAFQKWISYGMPADIYKKHPQFCLFLETSGLFSQMKVTRHVPFEIDGEAALLVEGQPMKWSVFNSTFEAVYSKHFKETFLIHKKSRKAFTFLDNDKGFQPHHPYLTERAPISKLNQSDYEKVLSKAQMFVRPEEQALSEIDRQNLNEQRPYILQLVTSYVKGPDTHLHKLLINSKHPYIRLIIGKDNAKLNIQKGEVYEVGYGWKNKVAIPFATTLGQFRSPDIWEYVPCEKKIVTNIPISEHEAQALYRYTMKYHRDGLNLCNPIGFHIVRQNCSTYVRSAMDVAGISVPTEISLGNLLSEIAPDRVKKWIAVGYEMNNGMRSLISRVAWILPHSIQNAFKGVLEKVSLYARGIFKALVAFSLVPLYAALGEGLGEAGVAFVAPGEPQKLIRPDLHSWRNWFKMSNYRFNLPGVLQQWQLKQSSTVVYDHPVKLAIVP